MKGIITNVIIVLIVVCLFICWWFIVDDYSKQLNEAKSKLNENNIILDTMQEELTKVQDDYQLELDKSTQLNDELLSVKNELDIANATVNDLKNSEYKLVYMGDFKLTHYCPGYHGEPCGTGDGVTATGTKVTAGRTIAVDTSIIPYGTTVYISGYGFLVAEDCGGGVKGNHIDIAVSDHSTALSMGTKTGDVWILVKNS